LAHHKSAIRRIRRTEKARKRNIAKKTLFKTLQKRFGAAKGEEAVKIGRDLVSYTDRLVRQGVLHWKKAARVKSVIYKKAAAGAKAA
jgi:small subunit ribosomal protein S20